MLLNASYTKTEVFGLEIPTEIEGVPSEILDPTNTVSSLIFFFFFSSYFTAASHFWLGFDLY